MGRAAIETLCSPTVFSQSTCHMRSQTALHSCHTHTTHNHPASPMHADPRYRHPPRHTRPPPRVGSGPDRNGSYCPAHTCNTFSKSPKINPTSDWSHFFCIKLLQLKPTFMYALHDSRGTFNTALNSNTAKCPLFVCLLLCCYFESNKATT